MTTDPRQKQNFLLDIKCDTYHSSVGWETKECGWVNTSQGQTSVNGKQLTVGNMAQSCVSSTQNDLTVTMRIKDQDNNNGEQREKSHTDEEKKHERTRQREREDKGKSVRRTSKRSMKLENIVNEERNEEREITMKFRKKKEYAACVHAPLKQICNTIARQKTWDESHTTTCMCYTTYRSKFRLLDWMESAQQKKTNARGQVVRPTTLVLLHQLDGYSMNTHAGRTSGESLEHLLLQICCESSPLPKKENNGDSKMISTKNVHLLAFVGNARSIVPTRTLNFGGECAKQFAKLELLVPTNNSTLHRIISDQRRTCVQLRHRPPQLPCASWSAGYESLPTIVS